MMKRILAMLPRALLLLIVTCCVGFAAQHSYIYSSKQLLAYCKEFIAVAMVKPNDNTTNINYFTAGTCSGFLSGIESSHMMLAVSLAHASHANPTKEDIHQYLEYCIPAEVTKLQLAKMITTELEQHPQQLNSYAIDMVTALMKDKFPCKQPR